MIEVVEALLRVLSLLLATVKGVLVPASLSELTLVQAVVWTPVAAGLVVMTRRVLRCIAPARRTAAPPSGRQAARPSPRRTRRRRSAERAAVAEARQALAQAQRPQRQPKAPTPEQEQRRRERAAAAEARKQLQQQRQQERKAAAQARQAEQEQRRQARAAAQEQRERERAAAAEARQAAQQARAAAQEQREQERAATAEARAAAAQARQAEQEQRRQSRAAAQEQRAAATAQARAARRTTRAFGADPTRVYEFRYRVVSLDELVTSNTDTGAINPAYDPALQPRQRDRAASQRQIDQVARRLTPEAYLLDFHQLDKGAPIIGSDRLVESGNGRTLALRRAREQHPERYAAYQAALRCQLAEVGLTPADLEGVADPVLVRERVTQVEDRAAFAREANAPPVLQMSTLEQALVDAQRLSNEAILRLSVREDQSIDQALRARSNAGFVRDFMGTLSENEQAVLMRRDGSLSQAGIWRVKAAVFARVFPGESGRRLAETFLEALDSTTKNFENAISAALPELARAEGRIAAGERPAGLSLAEDFSKALDMLARLKEQEIEPHIYVEQSIMWERELTPLQERILLDFDAIGRRPKAIREFLQGYARAVEELPDPGQVAMFEAEPLTKEQLYDRITGRAGAERKAA
ncbi:MAG TPA: hypothetical protein VFS21_09100 [Roseiflexaceae bacterium]|nr:hypothetical protein [Roseiflexaceae bacterium]